MQKFLSPSMFVSLAALLISLGGAGYSATGGNFLLGKSNSATTASVLSAPIAGKALQVTNNSTGAAATALGLNVAAGHPPMIVNSAVRVTHLNADLLDGLDSAAFVRSAEEHWHYIGDPAEPPFENGWRNYDTHTHSLASYQHAAYRVDANGIVHVRGMIKGGTLGLPFFHLPGSYCPYFAQLFPVTSNAKFGEVRVTALQFPNDCYVFANVGSTLWISLSGVSYLGSIKDYLLL